MFKLQWTCFKTKSWTILHQEPNKLTQALVFYLNTLKPMVYQGNQNYQRNHDQQHVRKNERIDQLNLFKFHLFFVFKVLKLLFIHFQFLFLYFSTNLYKNLYKIPAQALVPLRWAPKTTIHLLKSNIFNKSHSNVCIFFRKC